MAEYTASHQTRRERLARQAKRSDFLREIRARFPGGQVYDYGDMALVEYQGQMFEVRRRAYHVHRGGYHQQVQQSTGH